MENFEKLMHDLCNSDEPIGRWICTYEQKSALGSIIRDIPPMLAIISVNDNTKDALQSIISGTDARPYSSKGFSIKIKDNGKTKSIALDSKSGQVLCFFEDEQECKDHYNSLIQEHITGILIEKNKIIEDINKRLDQLRKQVV